MRQPPVLLTRPVAVAMPLAELLRARGVTVTVSPLIRIDPVGEVPNVAGALLTSGAAVARIMAAGGVSGTPAWVVGPRTAELARAAGFDVRGVGRDVAALVDLVPDDAPPLTHLRGEETRGDLAARLAARGLQVSEAVIYRQSAQPLSPEGETLLRSGPVLIPLYSPRSAVLLAQACPPGSQRNFRLLALSPAVAAACPVPPLGVSETPDGTGMLALLWEHLP